MTPGRRCRSRGAMRWSRWGSSAGTAAMPCAGRSSPSTTPRRCGSNDAAFRLHGGRTLTTLLNAVKFHSENARADQMATAPRVPRPTRGLDRWLLSRLEGTILAVDRALEDFEPRLAASAVARLVDELSTRYLRRSRPRFWQEGDPRTGRRPTRPSPSCWPRSIRLVAPLAPFTAEYLHFQLHQWPMEDPQSLGPPRGLASPDRGP